MRPWCASSPRPTSTNRPASPIGAGGPLSKRQLEYALADVTYLRLVYEILSKELEKTGRAPWVEEEEATLKDPATYRLEPAEAWRRLKPRSSNKRFLSVLAGVAAWREREAQNARRAAQPHPEG